MGIGRNEKVQACAYVLARKSKCDLLNIKMCGTKTCELHFEIMIT